MRIAIVLWWSVLLPIGWMITAALALVSCSSPKKALIGHPCFSYDPSVKIALLLISSRCWFMLGRSTACNGLSAGVGGAIGWGRGS